MRVVPQTPSFGAVVDGVRIQDADPGDVRQALLRYKVVWFRDQDLDADSLTDVGARFGTLTEAHPVEPSLEGHPEVLPLDSDEGAHADVWHSDLTFQDRPPLGALLFAVEVPDAGGDTVWSDTVDACRAVSPALRAFLATLTATHSASKAVGYFAARDASGGEAMARTAPLASHHPVIRVHPDTGDEALFVNPLFTERIDGIRRRESDALLGYLYELMTAAERTVRWKWSAGDLAMWDNRCTMHYALLNFGTARRRMLRVALKGDQPLGVGAHQKSRSAISSSRVG